MVCNDTSHLILIILISLKLHTNHKENYTSSPKRRSYCTSSTYEPRPTPPPPPKRNSPATATATGPSSIRPIKSYAASATATSCTSPKTAANPSVCTPSIRRIDGGIPSSRRTTTSITETRRRGWRSVRTERRCTVRFSCVVFA